MNFTKQWVTEGFEAFRKGTFGNGGQNLYVSRKGVLQRIHQYDLTHNGYFDLVFANCQNHHEAEPAYLYQLDGAVTELPAQGALSGTTADLNGDGFQDLIVAGYYDMAAPFASTDIYFGSPEGYSEKRRARIPTPYAEDCCAGDFKNNGKPALVFAMPVYDTVRIFYQTDLGIEWNRYIDLPVCAVLVAAADLDGDGYDELIVQKRPEGAQNTICGSVSKNQATGATVYWGGPDGISLDNFTDFPELDPSEVLQAEEEKTLQSELEKKFEAPRLLKKIIWEGRECFTISSGKKVYFISATKERKLERIFELEAPMALSVSAGDINGNGYDDIAVACRMRNPGDTYKQCSYIFWNGPDGISKDRRTEIDTRQACDVVVAKLSGEKYCDVVFCQSSAGHAYT
ncbi:MAG: FG-GAP and VCBS repeat-containing protein, partial [Victivallales bacterium]|nr:FG-GAP and VCBS repeat-containing protein [Victivallales bacterium]